MLLTVIFCYAWGGALLIVGTSGLLQAKNIGNFRINHFPPTPPTIIRKLNNEKFWHLFCKCAMEPIDAIYVTLTIILVLCIYFWLRKASALKGKLVKLSTISLWEIIILFWS